MDIFNEEKFDKGGVILERIHPDLDVEPYVPYYEKMGYVVSIVEKPNGWVELIGEKKDTFEDAYGRFKDDIRENMTPRKMAKGGKIKELETDEFTYYVDEDGENVEMYRNSDNSLVSDNYFAENDLYERMQEIANGRENYVYINPDSLEYLDEYKYGKGGKFDDGGERDIYYIDMSNKKPSLAELEDKYLLKNNYFSFDKQSVIANAINNRHIYDLVIIKGNVGYNAFRYNPDTFNPLEFGGTKMFSKGGRTKIENDGVDFNEEMYRGILGDRDKDGTENADDVAPNNPEVSEYIEKDTPFSKTFRTLLDDKRMYDDSMYSIIGEMEKILPNKYDIIARTKTPFSILKKLVGKKLKFKRDEYGNVKNKGLTDVIGTTIATNNNSELMNLRGMIGVDNGDNGIFGEVIEVDDKFKIPACGYRAIHYIVLYNGVPVEIQLKTKRMKMLNEFSHPYYKAEDLDCDGMGELAEIVVMADNGSKEAQKEFADIFADKDRMRSIISKSYAKGGEVEWFDYSKIDLEELPYDLDRYFIKDADTKEIDLNLLEPTRAREKGVKNANKYMRMAYDGEIDRRKPISVYERNGKMFVFDGNSTIANAKNSGWKTIYVEMIDDPNDDFERGGRTKDAETLREMSSALKKGSGMHKKQSEQLMGASSSHKKQAKDLDRIADKISKGYARGGEVEFDDRNRGYSKDDFTVDPKALEQSEIWVEDGIKFYDDLVKIGETKELEFWIDQEGYEHEDYDGMFVFHKPSQKGKWGMPSDLFHKENYKGNLKTTHKFAKDVLEEYEIKDYNKIKELPMMIPSYNQDEVFEQGYGYLLDDLYNIVEKYGIEIDNRKEWHTKGYGQERFNINDDEQMLFIHLPDATDPLALANELFNLALASDNTISVVQHSMFYPD